jgi:uncharacterized protein YifE (UPF0438 family)
VHLAEAEGGRALITIALERLGDPVKELADGRLSWPVTEESAFVAVAEEDLSAT